MFINIKNYFMKTFLLLKVYIIAVLMFVSNLSFAQKDSTKNKINTDLSADIFSRYIWRGAQFGGNSPSLQPCITANYKKLEIGTWGAYSIGNNNYQEIDLFLQYSFLKDKISIIVTDYFFPTDTGSYKYFDYKNKTTGHILESGLIFNLSKKTPLKFSAFVNFYGADYARIGDNPADTKNFNTKTGIQYSNYFELSYEKTTTDDIDLNFFLGFTLSNPKHADATKGYIGEKGFYGTGPGVINIGITAKKSLKITNDYSLPLTASFITNPQAEKVFLIFGISF